jgi:hypothetical protein
MTERNWEASARARLERLVAETVGRIRDTADQIERDARGHVKSAAEDQRAIEFQTYPRVAGQVVHTVQTLLFNLALENLIDAAADVEAARTARIDTGGPLGKAGERGAHRALAKLLGVLDGWIEGARSNHDGLDHRGEPMGSECWTQFHPSDIRRMVNDAAREVGLSVEFADPEIPTEDKVR